MVKRSNKRTRGRLAKGNSLDVDGKPKVLKRKKVDTRKTRTRAVALT